MYDANLTLQAAVTKTAAFNGTGLDLKTGTPRRGMKARFLVTNYGGGGAGAVFTPAIDHSDDNTTYYRLSQGVPLTCGTAAATSEQFVPVETSKRYIRSSLDLSPTTSTPSIIYSVDLGLARP